MYLHRFLYVLAVLVVVAGLLLKIPRTIEYLDAIVPPALLAEGIDIPFTSLLLVSLAVLISGRALEVLVDIRRQLLRIRDSVSETGGYPF